MPWMEQKHKLLLLHKAHTVRIEAGQISNILIMAREGEVTESFFGFIKKYSGYAIEQNSQFNL